MKKAKERLDAESTHPQTTNQKLKNFWFYYRWHVIFGAAAVVLVGFFVRDMLNNVEPDYKLGIVTGKYVSEEQQMALQNALEQLIDDRNGDGKVVAAVSLYEVALGDEETPNPQMHMANITRFMADLQTSESTIFLSERPVEYQKTYESFQYNDGTLPAEGAEPDADKLGVLLSETELWDDLAKELYMEDYYLIMRAQFPEVLERNPKLKPLYESSEELFNRIVG